MRWLRRVGTPLLCLALALALVTAGPASGQTGQPHGPEQEPEMILPSCGIRYPGGFDPNTVGELEGSVAALARPERGPVTFRLEAGGESYIVLAAPAWYWEERKPEVRDGARVRVKGSKTMGADGKLYLVVQEIFPVGAGEPVIFRDARGKPRWSGCGPKGCGGRRR